ncbi:sensor histidine kinase [Marinospirillum sp.]|uniref:sensor histidine kinase n=1 Tax=Marinospirillum sp. TaxID=2183934 RepID=UPI003A8C1C96
MSHSDDAFSQPPSSIVRQRLLIAVLALLLAASLWPITQGVWNKELHQLQEQSHNELLLHVAGLRGKLSQYEYLAQLLTEQEDLRPLLLAPNQADDWQQLNQRLDRFRAVTEASDIYLMDAQGWTLAASNWWRPDSFVGQNFAFRPYFQQAMQGEQGRFFGLGTTSGARGYYFSYPVLDAGQPIGVLVVKIEIHAIEEPWRDPLGELMVTDEDGVIFISSRPDWRLLTLQPLERQRLQHIQRSLQYAGRQLRPLAIEYQAELGEQSLRVRLTQPREQERDYLMMHYPLPELGWTVHIIKDLTPLYRRVLLAGLLTGLLFLAFILLALFVDQRRHAQKEKRLWQHQAHRQLQKAHDQLEQRVHERTADLSASNQRLLHEIQRHQKTEAQLRSTQKELIQAAQLALLGEMAASINHEINQPLSALRSYSQNALTLIERGQLDTAQHNLVIILELIDRMAKISAQLRVFSRQGEQKLGPVSLQAACRYALRLYATPLAQGKIALVEDMPDEELFAWADMVSVEQILVNLISNALHAVQDQPQPWIKISARAVNAQQVVLQVWDQGGGIDPAHLDDLFTPFYTRKESGLGLGLSISSRLAQELQGQLSAANHWQGQLSGQGQPSGAVFTLILPRDQTERHTSPAQASTSSRPLDPALPP